MYLAFFEHFFCRLSQPVDRITVQSMQSREFRVRLLIIIPACSLRSMLGRSSMYILNSIREVTDPCSKPLSIFVSFDSLESILTRTLQ